MLDVKAAASCLSAMLEVPIDGEARFEKGVQYNFIPRVFKTKPSFIIETRRIYARSARSTVHFSQYAGVAIDQWFDRPERAVEAFRFFDSSTKSSTLRFHVGSREIQAAQDLFSIDKGQWKTDRLSLSAVCRLEEGSEADPVIESSFALIGFCLLLSGVYDAIDEMEFELEGARHTVKETRIERSRKNRMLCLRAYGDNCMVCGINMSERYGAFAQGAIEVHHVRPVASLSEPEIVNPLRDLIPVCPNCHTALHCVDPPMAPESLKELLRKKAL